MSVGDGGGACVRSGGVNGRDYCRIPGVIRELWEELPYSIPFFLKFFLNKEMGGWGGGGRFSVRLWEGGCQVRLCVVGEVTEVHVISGRFLKVLKRGRGHDM